MLPGKADEDAAVDLRRAVGRRAGVIAVGRAGLVKCD
jgi:hypothetical protein